MVVLWLHFKPRRSRSKRKSRDDVAGTAKKEALLIFKAQDLKVECYKRLQQPFRLQSSATVSSMMREKRATTQTSLDHFFIRIDRTVGFPSGSVVKNLPANAEDTGDVGSIPGSRRSPGKGSGYPL